MDLLMLSLPEASYTYLGLAEQAALRALLRHVVSWIVVINTFRLVWHAWGTTDLERWKAGISYLLVSVVLCILFWPELTPFTRRVATTALQPEQVSSYAAQQDPDAEIVTAADTGDIPQNLQAGTLITPGFQLLLPPLTQVPLTLARLINSQTHRTFSTLLPTQWLLGVTLTSDVTTAVGDWVHNCYLPILTGTMEGQEGRTQEELLPWGNGPLRQGLATREVTPGAQTGISWMRGPGSSAKVRCDVYLDAIELRTQAWLYELKSPRGTPLIQVFEEDLGLTPRQQGRFILYREMFRAAGPAVPPPSLTGIYTALRGTSVGINAVSGGSFTGTVGVLTGTFSWVTTLFAALRGGVSATQQEIQRMLDAVSWIVGLAALLTWWGPYILGLILQVLLLGFPFAFLWCFVPGRQFTPLLLYFTALAWACQSPLWWAIVDQAQRLAGATAPLPDETITAGLQAMATSAVWRAALTVLGVLLVPLISAALLFGAYRMIGTLWRGGV